MFVYFKNSCTKKIEGRKNTVTWSHGFDLQSLHNVILSDQTGVRGFSWKNTELKEIRINCKRALKSLLMKVQGYFKWLRHFLKMHLLGYLSPCVSSLERKQDQINIQLINIKNILEQKLSNGKNTLEIQFWVSVLKLHYS